MVGMTWEANGHHVNIEVFADLHVEVFYQDLKTGDVYDDDSAWSDKDGLPDLMWLQRVLGK